jgi:hypothetical protein
MGVVVVLWVVLCVAWMEVEEVGDWDSEVVLDVEGGVDDMFGMRGSVPFEDRLAEVLTSFSVEMEMQVVSGVSLIVLVG